MHARRRAAFGGGAVSDARRPRVDHARHVGHVQPRRRDLGRRQQRLGRRRRRRVRGHRRRRTTPAAIAEAVGDRRVLAIVCAPTRTTTTSTPRRRSPTATGAPILLHPADRMLWELRPPRRPPGPRPGRRPGASASAASTLEVLHTPGHAPGRVCLYAPALGVVFTGDTLFDGRAGRDRALVQRLRRRSSSRSATGC